MGKRYLGIDIGTFETKGVLVDEHGVVVARARRRHGISTPHPGHVEQDADDVWWHDLVEVSRELVSAVGDDELAGVGCSAIGPCVLPVDADLRPLRPAILYGIDARSHAQVDELTARIGEDALLERCGNLLTSQSAGAKIKWIADEEPDVAASTAWYLTSQSYLVARLTGEVIIDHATAGYFHPLYDLERQGWRIDGCDDFVALEQLPEIRWSSEIAGAVTADASAATGIPEGVPVIVGTTDAPAEAVASTVLGPGDMMLMYGSSGYMIEVVDHAVRSRTLWSAPFVFAGTYVAAAGTSTAGTASRWIAEMLDLDASQGDELLFGDLMRLVRESPVGARGVLMLPHFSGERTPVQDAHSRAAFAGISLDTSRADLARAVVEGAAHSIAHAVSAYGELDAPPTRVVAIGGGTKNEVLVQTVSDLCGFEQRFADTEGASYGDAALAALATGGLLDVAGLASWPQTRDGVVPHDEASDERALLLRDQDDYVRLYEALRPMAQRRAKR